MTRSNVAGGEGQLLDVALLEPDRDAELGCLASSLGDHRGREVDPGDAMPARGQLEGEKAGAAAGVQRVQRGAAAQHEVEDAVPGGALVGRADAVAEVLVEGRRPPVPVRRDLLLDDGRSTDVRWPSD